MGNLRSSNPANDVVSSEASDTVSGLRRRRASIDERVKAGRTSAFAIALDGTGSMDPLIETAKRSIAEIIRRVVTRATVAPKIQLFVYRDYDCRPIDRLEQSIISEDAKQLERFLDNIGAFGGGANGGEAVELALTEIARSKDFAGVLLAGDEPSNSRQDVAERAPRGIRYSHDIAKDLGATRKPVFAFRVGSRPSTQADFEALARLSGGQYAQLDGSTEMIDLAVIAILSRLKGADAVASYLADNCVSRNTEEFGVRLLQGPTP